MSRLPVVILLLLLAAFPAAASASSAQSMTFEAPRELLDPGTRDRTLQEIRDFGVDRIRVLVYWKDYAPAATSKPRPAFDAADPNAYPAGAWDRLDGLFASAQARGVTVQLTLTGPVPRWATKTKRDYVTRPSTEGVPGLRHRGRPPLRRPRRRVVDLERAQPPAVPAPAVREEEARSPRASTATSSSPASAACAASGNGADTLLFGETAPRGTPRVVAPLAFLRGALCLDRNYHRKRPAASASRPAASPTTPTRRASARASAPRTATT